MKETENTQNAGKQALNIPVVSKCFICGKIVTDEFKIKNHFEIACKQHEGLAEISTQTFFEKYPDFTKW